ncbi:23S rRNA (uracil(1939)-C(5))-methyltransferase RlmD [bacterium]|jgi:23S rRNA (uracil1939-C5)-methyltransferase|nr:23S rRNA (uracil(1939)-C(5))-methyltransferase RlmD [bacterium]
MQLKKGTQVQVEFTSLNSFAQGYATLDIEGQTYNLVCPDAYPGDLALVNITKIKKNFLESELVQILKSSNLRVETRNNYFGISNATPLEALIYSEQLEIKEKEVQRILSNLDLLANCQLNPISGMQDPWYYRNKVEYSFGYTAEFKPALGFHVKHRRFDIVDATSCHLFMPQTSTWLEYAKQILLQDFSPYQYSCNKGDLRNLIFKKTLDSSQLMLVLEISQNVEAKLLVSALDELAQKIQQDFKQPLSVYLVQTTVQKGRCTTQDLYHLSGPLALQETLTIQDQEFEFEIFPNSFFQPNPHQAQKILSLVQAHAQKLGAKVIYDLFCGTGTLGIVAAASGAKLFGIDIVPASIELAIKNAKQNGLKDYEFVADDIYKNLQQYSWPEPDLILLDPPRKGLGEKTIDLIADTAVANIVYVSCNLKTFAQDAKYLQTKGYTLKELTPVDQFPHTKHLEIVSCFIKNN